MPRHQNKSPKATVSYSDEGANKTQNEWCGWISLKGASSVYPYQITRKYIIMYSCMYVCMYVCMYIYIYMYKFFTLL